VPITQQATISVMQIEVKALRIGAKQVTQSVFRQLPTGHIWYKNGAANGHPWGFVNYFWKGCCSYIHHEPHTHLVWSSEDKLYRQGIVYRAKRPSVEKPGPNCQDCGNDKKIWLSYHGNEPDEDYNIETAYTCIDCYEDCEKDYYELANQYYKEELVNFEYRRYLLNTLEQLYIAV